MKAKIRQTRPQEVGVSQETYGIMKDIIESLKNQIDLLKERDNIIIQEVRLKAAHLQNEIDWLKARRGTARTVSHAVKKKGNVIYF